MQTKFYVGLDLHSNNTYVGVLDSKERRVLKGKFPNQLEVILALLDPYKKRTVGVVVKSTFNWYWLVDGLMDNGYKVHLAHPAAFKQYSGLKHTDDEHDAFFLAKMLKLDILPEGHIMPREERQLRDPLRKRLKLVRQRTTHILSFKSLVSRNLGISMPSNEVKKLEDDEMHDLFDNEHLALSTKVNITAMNNLKWQIYEIQNTLLKATKALAHKLARACFYIMRDQVSFDETKIFGKPSKVEKGCAREPKRGLGTKPISPIGMSGAAPKQLDHIT